MMLLSMKTYLALLWGISILFGMESMSASITEINSTAEPEKTTKQMSSVHVRHTETLKPTGVREAPADTTVAPTVKEEIVTDSSGLVAMNTVAATTSSSGPQLPHASTAVTTTAGAAHPSHNTNISETAKPSEDPIHQQSPATSNDTNAPATASAATLTTVDVSSPQPPSTHKLEVTSELSSTTSPADSATVFTLTPGSPSASTSTITTANPASEADATSSETSTTSAELSSTYQPVSVTKNVSTSHLPDTAAPAISFSTESPISPTNVSTTNVSPSNVSTTSVSPSNVSSTNVSTTNVSTTNVSTTNVSPTNVSPTNVSTTNASIFPAYVPKRLPSLTTKSTPATTKAPCEFSKSTSSSEVQPCSTRVLVKHCLIAIASLAAVATIFMVTTIILCTKLSIRKYKVKKHQPATEMMCISALLPESYTYSRQRNAVSNGVLVMHGGADSDEDGGDNLTLSSFLPENDRFV